MQDSPERSLYIVCGAMENGSGETTVGQQPVGASICLKAVVLLLLLCMVDCQLSTNVEPHPFSSAMAIHRMSTMGKTFTLGPTDTRFEGIHVYGLSP